MLAAIFQLVLILAAIACTVGSLLPSLICACICHNIDHRHTSGYVHEATAIRNGNLRESRWIRERQLDRQRQRLNMFAIRRLETQFHPQSDIADVRLNVMSCSDRVTQTEPNNILQEERDLTV